MEYPQKNSPLNNILSELGPLYHNYSFFGVNNQQLPGIFELNQKAKAPIISAYIAFAIAKSRKKSSDSVSFSELFCADGYYAMVAARLGCERCIGIDNNKDRHLAKAKAIAEKLSIPNIDFLEAEITPKTEIPQCDIIANIGGLYHVTDPANILRLSYQAADKYLIVQNVVSLARTEDSYFESPAPGWTWGNRYSQASFDKLVKRICPKIIDYHFNELEGNDRLEDRGSVYYLIEK